MIGLQISAGEPPRLAERILERRWPSRIDLKQEIMDEVAAILLGRGWVAADESHWVYLCLDEAVVNAMLHGNEGDPRLDITVTVWCDQQRWAVVVADQGEGFTADRIPDHEQPQSLMLEHGRGIRIMREWLDELVYYRNGSCAWLSRRRADCHSA